MKLLTTLLLITALTLPVHAQNNFSRPQLPLNSGGPQSISKIRYYWVASDLPNGVVTGNWTDRINSYVLTQGAGASRPTNTVNGVHFNGSQFLTNSPTFVNATNGVSNKKGALWVVVTPATPSATYGCFIGSDSFSGYGTYTKNDGTFQSFLFCGSGNYGTYSSGTSLDFTANITASPACTNAYYKNGTLVASSQVHGDFSSMVNYVGWDGTAFNFYYKGYIMEIAWFSDQLTAVEITALHTYAAARYGY